jgi:hypothetical protein
VRVQAHRRAGVVTLRLRASTVMRRTSSCDLGRPRSGSGVSILTSPVPSG